MKDINISSSLLELPDIQSKQAGEQQSLVPKSSDADSDSIIKVKDGVELNKSEVRIISRGSAPNVLRWKPTRMSKENVLISERLLPGYRGVSSDRDDASKSESHIDFKSLTINHHTFRSFVDPSELLWGGTYFACQGERPALFAEEDVFNRFMSGIESQDKSVSIAPSLRESATNEVDEEFEKAEALVTKPKTMFGTWDGVFAPCLLNIFGVIMFLRLPWVVAQAGVYQSFVIILLSGFVVLLTSFSMSAIATNGKVLEGGAYFMISRSLGPEVGGAVGILFAIGMSVSIAMYAIGFGETMVKGGFSMTGNEMNDIRIIALCCMTLCMILCYVGIGWVTKAQVLLLGVLILSIISFFIGAFTNKEDLENNLYFLEGWRNGNLEVNMESDYRTQDGVDYDFISTFAVFFPAATGIMAGANRSGELKKPEANIPKGTLWAIGVSMTVYLIMALFCGAVATRGEGGLHDNVLIMEDISFWGPLILFGVYAATFTSALASLVGAPRILLRIAKDGLFNFLTPFAKVNQKGEPLRGYAVAFLLGAAGIAIGSLNAVTPLITMFFMLTYGLVNLSCFMLTISDSPGWRPSFKYYHWSTSFLGFLLCIVIMFAINYIYALVAFLIAAGLYKYIELSEQDINWGSAQEARNFNTAIHQMLKLRKDNVHVKNFRPGYLVLTGPPATRAHLVYFGDILRRTSKGLLVFGHVTIGHYQRNLQKYRESHLGGFVQSGSRNFPQVKPKVKGFFESVIAQNIQSGAQILVQMSGLGRLKPNVVVMGYKEDWQKKRKIEPENVKEYVNMVADCFKMRLGVMICRGLEKFAWTETALSNLEEEDAESGVSTMDIWWLLDDGGLSVLVPHLLRGHKFFQGQTKIRLLVVVERELEWSAALVTIQQMITKFRLNMEVIPVATEGKSPSNETVNTFEAKSGKELALCHQSFTVSRWLRVGELIREWSSKAMMLFITLPLPRARTCEFVYMALLENLSEGLPPTVLMRGANVNVLTYYLE